MNHGYTITFLTKRSSTEWHHKGSPSPKKLRITEFAGKDCGQSTKQNWHKVLCNMASSVFLKVWEHPWNRQVFSMFWNMIHTVGEHFQVTS
ncbi:hypothetical protein LAZ67_10002684 [Cordylochernes scorpioides]|uniref:Uncharacterized protein n=1 Tax=Cordylochernes scorpioides TaxID=51811 RepID=A0ABY6KWS1_9ARAC|nr:hypothetical protein LAZ67_10002684 [Cordylochernes scorpioides]